MNDDTPADADLLRQYIRDGSEPAFRELVKRHIGLVQATARRVLTSTPDLANDITQTVFTDLAKQATTLSAEVVLAGWLHRHAYFLALTAARAERRRGARERTAMEIHALNENSGTDSQWAQLASALDAALDQLDDQDRAAIVLRYLQQRDLRSIGLALDISDDTAQKRVSRALEKLRGFLTRSGVTVASVTALGTTLEAQPAPVVTPGRAASVSAIALSGVAVITTTTGVTLGSKRLTSLELVLLASLVVIIICCWRFYPSTETASTGSAPDGSAPATTADTSPKSSHELVFVEDKTGSNSLVPGTPSGTSANPATTQGTTTVENKPAAASQGFQYAAGPQTEVDSLIATAVKRFSPPTASVAPSDLSVRNLPMYSLTPSVVANGGGMGNAVVTGNYLVVVDASGQTVEIEEMFTSTDNHSTSYGVGDSAKIITGILAQLVSLPQVQTGSYEPRILWLDNVISVIWLKSNTESPDIFYLHKLNGRSTPPPQAALNNLPSESLVKFDTLYNVEDLMKLALPIAQEMVALDEATAARQQALGIRVPSPAAMGGINPTP